MLPWLCTVGAGRIFVVGLTGGIGAGKSTVLELFAKAGAYCVQADLLARAELNEPEVQSRIRVLFGGDLVTDKGVDRQALARIVFKDPEQLHKLNELIHPGVRRRLRKIQETLEPGTVLIYEVPLLFEAGLEHDFDWIVTVTAPAELRRERVKNRGWSADDWEAREARQLSLREKEKRADSVIENKGNEEELKLQVDKLYREFEERAGSL